MKMTMAEYIERTTVLDIITGNWLFMTSADDAIQTSVDMIRRLPAADVVERQKWIPVTERLPMRSEKAICFGKNGYMIGTYGEFGWMFPCYFGNVTHWMPLPKQPEEE